MLRVALTQKVHFDDAAGSNYTSYLLCEVGENTVLFISTRECIYSYLLLLRFFSTQVHYLPRPAILESIVIGQSRIPPGSSSSSLVSNINEAYRHLLS